MEKIFGMGFIFLTITLLSLRKCRIKSQFSIIHSEPLKLFLFLFFSPFSWEKCSPHNALFGKWIWPLSYIYIYITYIKPSEFDRMTGAYLVNVCIVRSSASKSLSKISRDVYAFEFIVLWSLLFVGIHDFGLFSFLSWLICSSQMVTWTWLLYGIVLNYPC